METNRILIKSGNEAPFEAFLMCTFKAHETNKDIIAYVKTSTLKPESLLIECAYYELKDNAYKISVINEKDLEFTKLVLNAIRKNLK